MLFFKKHAMRGADFSDIRRKDVWSIPLTILREMIINALVHSDYSQRGAPIRIAFFDDRIEIVEIGMRLRFTVYLAKPVKPAIEALKHIGVESGVESPDSNMKFQILALLNQSSLAKSQIATELGKTKPNRYLNDLMHKLLTDGCVEYTIPDKPNSRLQKYRLTSTGARQLEIRPVS